MTHPCVVDTSVVVSGLLTSEDDAPTAHILDAMVAGRIPFLLSLALLAEYRTVLLRPRIRERHRLDEAAVDTLLTEIATNGIIREPEPTTEEAPDSGDQHLWDLLATQAGAVLITGDQTLFRQPPSFATVVTPARFVADFLE